MDDPLSPSQSAGEMPPDNTLMDTPPAIERSGGGSVGSTLTPPPMYTQTPMHEHSPPAYSSSTSPVGLIASEYANRSADIVRGHYGERTRENFLNPNAGLQLLERRLWEQTPTGLCMRPLPPLVLKPDQAIELKSLIVWDVFLFHDVAFADATISTVFKRQLNIRSDIYASALNHILEVYTDLQETILSNMETHVMRLSTYNPSLMNLGERELRAAFERDFTGECFYEVWTFMRAYIIFDRSADLGKYFVENIYVNFATVMAHVVYLRLSQPGISESYLRGFRLQAYEAWKAFAYHPVFAEVGRDEFCEVDILNHSNIER